MRQAEIATGASSQDDGQLIAGTACYQRAKRSGYEHYAHGQSKDMSAQAAVGQAGSHLVWSLARHDGRPTLVRAPIAAGDGCAVA
ncbi:MAG: hypothetical protein JWO59_2591 [Chloroflexi bacterium]|nr:hypothetical protein [Chloroflexota bacterium]